MKKYLFFLLPLLALGGCDSTKNVNSDNGNTNVTPSAPDPVALTYQRGPCLGKCPVYTLTVNEKGEARMTGRKFSKREGDYTQTLSPQAYKDLMQTVKTANMTALENKYDSGIADAPVVTLTAVYADGGKKEITLRGSMPDVLKPVTAAAVNLYEADGWTEEMPAPDNTQSWKYSQGPCLGQCPVFTIDLAGDGTATMKGKAYAPRRGTYTKQISAAQITALTDLFIRADWWKTDYTEETNIADAARISIQYRQGDMIKQAAFRGRQPEKIKPITAFFRTLAEEDNWTMTEADDNFGLPDDVIADEIIVKMKPEGDINALVAEFSKQDMQVKKNLSVSQKMYLLSYEPNKASPAEMLRWIRERRDVESAELNRKVDIRED